MSIHLRKASHHVISTIRQSSALQDLLIWLVVTFLVSYYTIHYDAFESFHELSRGHEDWQLDEVFVVLFFVGLGGCLFGLRRYLDMQTYSRRLHREADFDSLTQLPNSRLAKRQLNHLLTGCPKERYVIAVLLDIDNFGTINHLYGRTTADMVLKHVATRLKLRNEKSGFVARINSDEFLACDLCDGRLHAIEDYVSDLRRVENVPIVIGKYVVNIRFSMGVAVYPKDSDNPDDLVRAAYLALEQAKTTNGIDWYLYREELGQRREYREMLSRQLYKAILNNELFMVYQPIWDQKRHLCKGFEALVRWNFQGASVPPFLFVNIAEEYGLINQLGDFVLRRSLSEMKDKLATDQYLAVNISAHQFHHDSFVPSLLDTIKGIGFDPKQLELELTETTLIDNYELLLEKLHRIRKKGVHVAIDDFGTGYSSLSRLNELSVDKLKIDRSFVEGIVDGVKDQNIVESVVSLGRKLNMQIVIEGVETEDQMDTLVELGCDLMQGYLFARPATLDKIEPRFFCVENTAIN
ncbi:bifunctional diguanylate cyclase/phosphodiesterase [Vibrio tritonius]|uniref:putative bifunctional diguanylate cyclase/phosphodiesterase n=1 Tax=Vibrio tritonius TaxID=1435069 RepID=UPI00315C9203